MWLDRNNNLPRSSRLALQMFQQAMIQGLKPKRPKRAEIGGITRLYAMGTMSGTANSPLLSRPRRKRAMNTKNYEYNS